MRIERGAAFSASLLVVSVTPALEPAPVPTIENTAGAWCALGERGTHHRVALDGHGGGQVGYKSSDPAPQVYKIVSLDIHGYDIEPRVRNSEVKDFTIRGTGTPRRLDLRSNEWFGKVDCRSYPEATWRSDEETLREAMAPEVP